MDNPNALPPVTEIPVSGLDQVETLHVAQARMALQAIHQGAAPDDMLREALAALDSALARNDALTAKRPGMHRDGDDGLTATLVRAMGLVPADVHGFRLTVMGGEWPMLEVLPTLPTEDDGGVARSFAERLEAAGRQFRMMPNDAPMAQLANMRDDDVRMIHGVVSLDGAGVDINEMHDLTPGVGVTVLASPAAGEGVQVEAEPTG